MMTGKQKIYFLLLRIEDARAITPSGQPLILHPANDLNKKYTAVELGLIFRKLELDEKVLKLLQAPNRIRNAVLEENQLYHHMDDGRYHIELIHPAYDDYLLRIKNEPEYEEFTGEKPPRSSTSLTYTFDEETVTVSINGKHVIFQRDTRKLALFKLLLKKPKGIYYDEVADKLEGAVSDEAINTKNAYYEACRGIEMSFAKIGITDFLHFDYNQANINPIYKRISI